MNCKSQLKCSYYLNIRDIFVLFLKVTKKITALTSFTWLCPELPNLEKCYKCNDARFLKLALSGYRYVAMQLLPVVDTLWLYLVTCLQFDILMIWMHLLARVFLSLLIKCESHFFLWCYLYFASCFYSVSQFKLQLPYLSHYTTSVHNESISLSYRLKRINQISWQHCTFFI